MVYVILSAPVAEGLHLLRDALAYESKLNCKKCATYCCHRGSSFRKTISISLNCPCSAEPYRCWMCCNINIRLHIIGAAARSGNNVRDRSLDKLDLNT